MHLAQQAADFLRSASHLSLFGFDMVIENGTGESGSHHQLVFMACEMR